MASSTITSPNCCIGESLVVSLPRLQRCSLQTRQHVLTFAAGVLGLLLLPPLALSAFDLSPDALIYPVSVTLTVLFVVQMWSWYLVSGSLFDPYTIFATSAMLFNGSRAVLQVFGLNRDGALGPNFSPQTTLATLYLVILALWSFHIGGTLGAGGRPPTTATQDDTRTATYDNVRTIAWLLIGVALVPSFILLREAVTAVMSYGYLMLFQREAATSLHALPQALAAFLVPGVLLLAAANKGKRLQLAVATTLIGLYTLVQLFLGSRALAAASIVPYVWLWHRHIKPLPKVPTFIAGLVFVGIIFPLVHVSRSFVGEDRLSPSTLMEAFYSVDNPAVTVVSEMGGSAVTIAHTVDLVPAFRPYDCGGSYGLGLLTLIPNLFWDLHPAIAKGTPNVWLTRTVDPDMAARGGGLGYSFIAEAYLNAGWAGVILVSGALGFGFAWLATAFLGRGGITRLACVATVLAFSLKYARSDCTEIVRGIVWYALGTYALARAVSREPVFKAGRRGRWRTVSALPRQATPRRCPP